VGIYKTLLGEEGFKKGLALYFQRHDGQAVTCDDFRQAMAGENKLHTPTYICNINALITSSVDANNQDLSQMDRWYSQAGTPVVTIESNYDATAATLTLQVSQHYPPMNTSTGEDTRQPVVIPLVTGLVSKIDGSELAPSKVLLVTEGSQTFVFNNIHSEPIVSTLRGYSAPVNLVLYQSPEDLTMLMAHDTDAFNRWEASNRYYTNLILDTAKSSDVNSIASSKLPDGLIQAVRSILQSVNEDNLSKQDMSLLAYALQLPDLMTLFNQMNPLQLDALVASRKHIKGQLAMALEEEFLRVYKLLSQSEGNYQYSFTPQEVGRRRLRNTCLDYLTTISQQEQYQVLAKEQFDAACCMTDKIYALSTLTSQTSDRSQQALESFYNDAQGQALVVNKWFSVQAMSDSDKCLDRLKVLEEHKDFTLNNPNRARSLYSIAAANIPLFHRADGKGYEFIAQAVLKLDAINPQVAARLAGSFGVYKRLDENRKEKVKTLLTDMIENHKLSPDTFEIVSRFLK
jgi:aminopeptidase N